jgi:signal transduction histidine kinase
VNDDGKGFVRCDKSGKKSFGLLGIRERVNTLGGKVEIASQPDLGTVVRVWLPFERTQAES